MCGLAAENRTRNPRDYETDALTTTPLSHLPTFQQVLQRDVELAQALARVDQRLEQLRQLLPQRGIVLRDLVHVVVAEGEYDVQQEADPTPAGGRGRAGEC